MSAILSTLRQGWELCTDLFFPPHCLLCGTPLVRQEEACCTYCLNQLPLFDVDLAEELMGQRVSASLPIHQGFAMYQFDKFNSTRKVVHAIKYDDFPSLGFRLGLWMGYRLLKNQLSETPDVIVYVPMSYWKYKRRGYNQAAVLAEGISKALQVPILQPCLRKGWATFVQAKSDKHTRRKNVLEVFSITKEGIENCKGKHVLLVDDIFTTGATMERCGALLLEAGAKKVSLAVLAMTR